MYDSIMIVKMIVYMKKHDPCLMISGENSANLNLNLTIHTIRGSGERSL